MQEQFLTNIDYIDNLFQFKLGNKYVIHVDNEDTELRLCDELNYKFNSNKHQSSIKDLKDLHESAREHVVEFLLDESIPETPEILLIKNVEAFAGSLYSNQQLTDIISELAEQLLKCASVVIFTVPFIEEENDTVTLRTIPSERNDFIAQSPNADGVIYTWGLSIDQNGNITAFAGDY